MDLSNFDNLDSKEVFRWFSEMSKIPRESGHEKEISDFLVKFAIALIPAASAAPIAAKVKIERFAPLVFVAAEETKVSNVSLFNKFFASTLVGIM